MYYKCNSNYKTMDGIPFDLGACCTCKHNNVCKYKQDRIEIINSIENTINRLGHETPISVEVTCREYKNKLVGE